MVDFFGDDFLADLAEEPAFLALLFLAGVLDFLLTFFFFFAITLIFQVASRMLDGFAR